MTASRQSARKPGPRMSSHSVGVALVLVAAAGFGSGALFAKPIYAAGVDWLTLLFWRFLVAAVLSWAWLVLVRGNRLSLRHLTRRRVLVLLALGVLYVTNSGTYFAALETVPASLAVLIVYLYPGLVAVLSIRFGRRLEGRRAWLALGISTFGVALAVGGIPEGAAPPLLGLALTIASPIIYAFWIVMAARLGGERRDRLPRRVGVAAEVPPQDSEAVPAAETESAPAAALMTTASAVVFTLAMVVTGRSVAPASIPGEAWLPLLGVGAISTAVALQAFYAGARRIGAARASLVSTVEPIYTITLASILFHETLTPIQLLGGALIIGGVLLAESGQGDVEVVPGDTGEPSPRPASGGAPKTFNVASRFDGPDELRFTPLTDGVVALRPPDERDLPAIHLGIHDHDVVRWLGPPEGSAADVLKLNRERWAAGSPTFSICDADDVCIGHVWINVSSTERTKGSVGYFCSRPSAGAASRRGRCGFSAHGRSRTSGSRAFSWLLTPRTCLHSVSPSAVGSCGLA